MKCFKLTLFILLSVCSCSAGDAVPGNSLSGNYAEIKGVKIYYEIHGSGQSLLMLHGGLGSSEDFTRNISELSRNFKVITFDRIGHGRSYDNLKAFSYSDMAENVICFLNFLKIDKVFLVGYSDGGVIGYHLAARYPDRIMKLVSAGANYNVAGLTDSTVKWTQKALKPEIIRSDYSPLAERYLKLSPQPENFDSFIKRTRALWLTDPYIEEKDLGKITIPVLLLAGDHDAVKLDHLFELQRILKNSQLGVLPNTSHSVFQERPEIISNFIIDFLK